MPRPPGRFSRNAERVRAGERAFNAVEIFRLDRQYGSRARIRDQKSCPDRFFTAANSGISNWKASIKSCAGFILLLSRYPAGRNFVMTAKLQYGISTVRNTGSASPKPELAVPILNAKTKKADKKVWFLVSPHPQHGKNRLNRITNPHTAFEFEFNR